MIVRDLKLKKVSDEIFHQLDDSDSRPMEWRRGFNPIKLVIRDLKLIHDFKFHERDYISRDSPSKDYLSSISSNVNYSPIIIGQVDEDELRDRIHIAVKNDDGEDEYSVERQSGHMVVGLRAGVEEKDHESFSDGVYPGACFRANLEPGADDLNFDLRVPKDQLEIIFAILKDDPEARVELCVEISSYSYEVDDALREWYHARDLVINDMTTAFISWLQIISGNYNQPLHDADDDWDVDLEPDQAEEYRKWLLTNDGCAHREVISNVHGLQASINSIVLPIWCLVAVLVGCAFFSLF